MRVGRSARSADAQPTRSTIDTATAIERFRNGRSISTPTRELQPAITNAIRATGELDDLEVTALVHAGVMKHVHLQHSRYPTEAACGATLRYSPDRRPGSRAVRKVSSARRHRISVGGRIRFTRTGSPRRPSGRLVFRFPASIRRQPDTARVGGHRLDADGSRRPPGTAPPSAARAVRRGPRAPGLQRSGLVLPRRTVLDGGPPVAREDPGRPFPGRVGAPATRDRKRRRNHRRPRARRGSPLRVEVGVVERPASQVSRRRR